MPTLWPFTPPNKVIDLRSAQATKPHKRQEGIGCLVHMMIVIQDDPKLPGDSGEVPIYK